MKILSWVKKNGSKTSTKKSTATFRDLNKSDREKFLKSSASDFSKNFTKVIVKLANE